MLSKIVLNEKIEVPNEALKYYDIVSEAVQNLSNATNCAWHFTESTIFDKYSRFTLLEGAVYGIIGCGALLLASKQIKKYKTKLEES